MARYSRSRFFPILLVIVIMIIAIAAIVSLARAIFFSDDRQPASTVQLDASREALLSTDAERKVRMTVRGAIVADEEFHSYRITVTPSSRSLVTYRGYLDRQVDATNLGNNVQAYEQFVHALDKANFAKGSPFDDERDDTRGICATGRVYEFEIINGDNTVERLWTSTCSGSPGSLDASVSQVSNLFVEQIPNAAQKIRNVNL